MSDEIRDMDREGEKSPGPVLLTTHASDRDLAAEYRPRMMAALDAAITIMNEANSNGLQIGFNIGRDQYGRQRVDQLQIFRPL